jgi:hypothetical protein
MTQSPATMSLYPSRRSNRLFHGILSCLVVIYQSPFLLMSTVSAQTACLSTTNQIALAEAAISDTSVPRTYIMCPFLLYSVGALDYYDQPKEGGQAMIPLRPNMIIKCGYTGRRDGECLIGGGDLFLDGTSYHGILDKSVDGVKIEGFTFIAPGRFAAEFTKSGSVEFVDCIFRVCLSK